MLRKVYLLFLLINAMLCVSKEVLAQQNIFSTMRSSGKRADNYYEDMAYSQALDLYKRAYKKDTSSNILKLKIADCYRMLNNPNEAAVWYRRAIKNTKFERAEDNLHYAQALMGTGNYEESKKWFQAYNSLKGSDSHSLRKLEGISNLSVFYEDSLTYPVTDLSINSLHADFSPVYYGDGVVFVSSRGEKGVVRHHNTRDEHAAFFDLFFSKIKEDGSLGHPHLFHKNFNDHLHEGPVTFFDNETKMIFTRSGSSRINRKKDSSVNRLMLYYAEKSEAGVWGDAQPLPFNSNDYSVGHPTIGSNNKVMYFVSDMPGGFGGTDLYVSIYGDQGWSPPSNLGPEINTSANELFPYIYKDSILYFSSSGYGGLGGLDIYRSELKEGRFGQVQNLGYPLNSSQDDFGIAFSSDGESGFFTSNRNRGASDDDIFRFDVVKVLVEGIMVNKLKEIPIEDVIIKVYENNQEEVIKRSQSNGKFILNLDPGKDYTIIASKDDFRTVRADLSTKEFSKGGAQVLKMTMEKTHKAYIKGVIRLDSMTTVPGVKIYYQEKGLGLIDTIISGENGEFNCEIESEVEYIFFGQKDGKYSLVNLKSTKRKRGSVLFYLNMQMQDYSTYTMKGVVYDSLVNVENARIFIHNEITGSIDTTFTDSTGSFYFDAASYGVYNITAEKDKLRTSVKAFETKNLEKPFIEMYFRRED